MPTPRTDKIITEQGQELFYSGTPENVQGILFGQVKELEQHAKVLETELIFLEKEVNALRFTVKELKQEIVNISYAN